MTKTDGAALVIVTPRPLDQNPAVVYLAGLSAGSRPAMTGALNEIAAMLTKGQVDALGLDWAALRFQHTAAIRAKLAEHDAPATANKKLGAGKQPSAKRLTCCTCPTGSGDCP